MEHEQPINAYVCQYCKGSFDKLENLSKHVQKIHTVSSSGKENRICPLCGTQCIKIEGYRNHLRHIHGHNEEGQVVLFKSFNDFLVWKNELEKRNYCKYVMRDLPKKLSSNDKTHIYRCDSSVGSMREKKSGVAVRESCPAVITAIESAKTKGVKIEHWNSHVGHIIPIEEEELDVAIGSLGTTEIVLTSDQRYQYEGQGGDGNIFFITESNDGSYSETFVKESPKKSTNLFKKTKAKVDSFSKPASQKFSYKKDPTKKSGSFNYSLASVACMKPSAKKRIIIPPEVTTTCSIEDSVSTTVTTSDALLPALASSVASSEIELATQSISDVIDVDISSQTGNSVDAKEKVTPVTLASPSKSIPITIANQTFEFINDGSLSGQVVLLNTLPGQNNNQNVLLCSDQKFISIGPAINVGTVTPKKGKKSKKSKKNNVASQIIVIPTASDKENVSSVQNILNLSQNSILLDSVVRNPAPSPASQITVIPTAPEKEKVSSVQNILNLSQNSTPIDSVARNTAASPASQITVIPTTPEKENVSSVQNTLNLSQNSISPDSVVRNPAPSILKTAKKSVQKLTKNTILSARKKISARMNAVSSAQKPITAEQKLSLGLNPSLDVTVVDTINLPHGATNDFVKSFKVADSVTLEVAKTTPNRNSTNFTTVTRYPSIASNSVLSPIKNSVLSVAQNSVSSVAQNSVASAGKNSVSPTAPICVSSVAQNSVPSSVPVNPILLNSFPPGQTFMSINNNLIPIGTPTAPMLPSNFSPGFVLTSPVAPSPVTRPVRSMMTYSRLASRVPLTSSTPRIRFTDKMTQNKQISIGTTTRLTTPPHPSTVPLLLIPNSGNQIGPSVPFSSPFVASSVNSTQPSSIRPNRTQPFISNSFISSSGCSVLPRPIISTSGSPVFTQLSPGTRLVSTPIISSIPGSFLSNNGQRISRPLLQNVPLLTNPGQQVPRSILQSISFSSPLIGQPSVAPVASRAIVSTTVSNAIKVQKVQLPFSKSTATSPSVTLGGISSVTANLSESTKVSSVVLNTEPISSAPQISIPPITSIASHKPGSVLFESQGDVYMLEPVEENPMVSNNTSVRNVPNKLSIAVPSTNGNTKVSKSDEARESLFEGNKANLSSLLKEKAVESQSILDTKVDGRVKSLSPRKSTDIKNGVQIKSVVQEKRHLKDDDVEILKKVKYYQMEMKYLSSQAECKRLKLELAKAQMKNKEIEKSHVEFFSGELSLKERADEDALHIDLTSDQDDLGLKQISNANDDVVESMAMDVDNSSHVVGDKTTEDQATCIQAIDNIESTNQCDNDSVDSNNCNADSVDSNNCNADSVDSNNCNADSVDSNNCNVDSGDSNNCNADSSDSNCGDNNPVDSGDSNHSKVIDLSLKGDQDRESLDDQNGNHDLEGINCDTRSDEASNLEIQKEACSTLHDILKNNILENELNDCNPSDQTCKTDSKEEFKDINESKNNELNINNSENQLQELDNELMDFSEIEENVMDVTGDGQCVNDSVNRDRFEVQELADKEMCVQNSNLDKEHLVQCSEEDESMDLDDQLNSSLTSEKVNLPCDKTQFQETLKELEFQYGSEETSDIYTMIRTSVLRSLYDDMKTLCEENKKLYEKLQTCSSHEDSCEMDEFPS